MNKYAKSLALVRTRLDAIFSFRTGEEQIVDGQLSALLRAWIPKILIGVVPHYGRHYWTRSDSRKTAQGEECRSCSILSPTVCPFSDVLLQLLRVCRAKTVPEFLVGRWKEPRPPVTSPYAPLSNELADSALLEDGEDEAKDDGSSEVESLPINESSGTESGIDAPEEVNEANYVSALLVCQGSCCVYLTMKIMNDMIYTLTVFLYFGTHIQLLIFPVQC